MYSNLCNTKILLILKLYKILWEVSIINGIPTWNILLQQTICEQVHLIIYLLKKSLIFMCYFSKELIALNIPTEIEPDTCGSQKQSANQCTNRDICENLSYFLKLTLKSP